MKKNERAQSVYQVLKNEFPDARCALLHKNPFELLIATILSAQCTDERVNKVTPILFKEFPDPIKMSKASQEEIESLIFSTGFYRNKAKSLIECSKVLSTNFNGEVPSRLEDLVDLPGVGRKTANVVLGNAFGIISGIVVDTHVKRLSNLLGLTRQTDPEKIETDLMKIFSKDQWVMLSHYLILHGRKTCVARRPRCSDCSLSNICPSSKIR